MNNQQQRSPLQQTMMMVAMGYLVWFAASQFGLFGPPPNRNGGGSPDKPALALDKAFVGIAADKGPSLTKAQAETALKKLDAEITANDKDAYSYWARLRAGLLQQYIVGESKAAIKRYDEIIYHAGSDDITAQATYQKGDLLWNESTSGGSSPSSEAAKTLEQLIHKGRGSPQFLEQEIFVPLNLFGEQSAAATATSTAAVSAPAFRAVKIGEFIDGSLRTHPQGILRRVDSYYSATVFHKIFDTIARVFGYQPAYSYGLAIIFFAIITRIAMQPLTRMQYDSFKGMSVIAPEMKKIQDNYKNKPEQQAQMLKEIQTLQRDHGVRPMLGCVLALIQMPFFFVVVLPFITYYEAHMELVGASFWWIQNLAQPDMPLLIIYALSQFLAMRLTSTPPTDPQQAQMMAMISIIFPLTVPFFMRFYSSAFPLYWMIYNVINTVFQYRMMKATDPEKSVIKTLVGTKPAIAVVDGADGAAALEAVTGAVPARPRQSDAKSSAKSSAKNGAKSAPRNTANGAGSKTSKSSRANSTADSDGALDDGLTQDGLTQEEAFEPLTGAPPQNGGAPPQNGGAPPQNGGAPPQSTGGTAAKRRRTAAKRNTRHKRRDK